MALHFPKRRKTAGSAAGSGFHQLNVKAWLMRRIQIALITRYAEAFDGRDRNDPMPSLD
jgi:hypothetical protein